MYKYFLFHSCFINNFIQILTCNFNINDFIMKVTF